MRLFLLSCVLMFLFPAFQLFGQGYEELVEQSAAYIEADRLDSAAISLQKAMSMEPTNENNPVLLLNLGILQRQLGQFNDAFVSFTASLANNPMANLVLHNRASLLCDMERYDEAMSDYDTLIRNFPDDTEAYYRRGLLYLEQHNRTKAEADFKKAEQIDPDNLYTRLSKALIYKLDDNWAAAEKIYTTLIRTEQTVDPSFYMNRAECYVNTDQIFRASADLRAVEDTQGENPYFYFLRGRVRYEQFDKVAARNDFKKAKELGYDAALIDEWLVKTEK